MDGILFPRFYSIWETEVEGSIQLSKVLHELTITQTFEENLSRGALFIYINSAVLGNELKIKTKTTQSGKDPIAKSVNMKVNMNLSD